MPATTTRSHPDSATTSPRHPPSRQNFHRSEKGDTRRANWDNSHPRMPYHPPGTAASMFDKACSNDPHPAAAPKDRPAMPYPNPSPRRLATRENASPPRQAPASYPARSHPQDTTNTNARHAGDADPAKDNLYTIPATVPAHRSCTDTVSPGPS